MGWLMGGAMVAMGMVMAAAEPHAGAKEAAAWAEAAARAAAEARVALPAARVFLLTLADGALANHGRAVLAWRALATGAEPVAAAAPGAAAAEAEADVSGSALFVVAAADNLAAVRALAQVRGWPGGAGSAWLLAVNGVDCEALASTLGGVARGRVVPGRVLAVSSDVACSLWRATERGAMMAEPLPRPLTAEGVSELWRGTDLRGAALNVTTLDYSPMLELDETVSPPRVGGFFGQLWAELERRLNFRSAWTKPLDGGWGSLRNGTWSGMVSLLLNGSADAALNAFTITKARLDAVAFTDAAIDTRICAFVGIRSGRGAVDWRDYFRPFSGALWAAAAATLAGLAGALLLQQAGRARWGDPRLPSDAHCEGPTTALFCVLAIFCQQGHDATPSSGAGRAVYWTAYATAVTLLAAYSAALIAALTVAQPAPPFDSFAALLEHRPRFRLAMAPSSGVLNTFDQARDPLLREVYRSLILPGLSDLPSNHAEVRRRLCADAPFAYMRSQILGIPLGGRRDDEGQCSVAAVPSVSFPETLAVMLPKRSPLRRILNWHLQQLKQTGVAARIRRSVWPPAEELPEAPFAPVALENVLPILVLLPAGVLASTLALAAEAFVHRAAQRRKRQYNEAQAATPSVEASATTSERRRLSSDNKDNTSDA